MYVTLILVVVLLVGLANLRDTLRKEEVLRYNERLIPDGEKK